MSNVEIQRTREYLVPKNELFIQYKINILGDYTSNRDNYVDGIPELISESKPDKTAVSFNGQPNQVFLSRSRILVDST
jgi:hypothetical protein